MHGLPVFLLLLFAIANYSLADAQDAGVKAGADPKPATEITIRSKVRLDLNGAAFLDPLPFDVPFRISGLVYDASLLNVKLYIAEGIVAKESICENDLKSSWEKRVDQQIPFILDVHSSLKPNQEYSFKFSINRTLNADEKLLAKNLIIEKLSAFLNKKLTDKQGMNFELIKGDIDNVSTDVYTEVKKLIAAKGLSTKEDKPTAGYALKLKDALMQLTEKYENVFHRALEEFSGNKTFFDGQLNLLQEKVTKENGFTRTAVFDTLIRNLQTLAKDINPDVPLSNATLDILLQACQAALNSLKNFSFPKSSVFLIEVPELEDILNTIQNDLYNYKNAPVSLKPVIEQAAISIGDLFAFIFYNDIIVTDDTSGTYEARALFYLSADIGVAIFPTIGKASPYLGTNIYLRPVNKQRPIYKSDYNPLRCFSFLVGVSFFSISQANKRDNLFAGNLNLLAGAGYRITDHIRVNGGFVFYKFLATNPILNKEKLGVNGFCSLSFDWDINSVFKSIFSSSIPK